MRMRPGAEPECEPDHTLLTNSPCRAPGCRAGLPLLEPAFAHKEKPRRRQASPRLLTGSGPNRDVRLSSTRLENGQRDHRRPVPPLLGDGVELTRVLDRVDEGIQPLLQLGI